MNNEHLLNECVGMYVKYDTKIGRHLADYSEIRGELERLKILSRYYTRKSNAFFEKYTGKDPDKNIEEDDLFPLTGVFYNIVMSYCRCFDTSKAHKKGSGSRRSIKLHDKFLGDVDQSILETHHMLKKTRDEIIAHAGVNQFEKFEYIIGIDNKGEVVLKPADDNNKLLSSPYVEIDRMEALLDAVIKKIDSKLEGLFRDANEEMDKITNNRSLFADKLYNQQPITQKDIY